MSNILQGLNETQAHDGAFLLTESRTYKLWESAGQKLMEAQLTADQINQIFKQVEQGATAAGGNRTMLGKGKDAAGAVKQAYDDLVSKAQNSGPIKGVDAMYDKAAEKLKQATGGDQGVMKYVQKYRDFAKEHPVAQGLIYSALIAAAGISGAGIGGAAALGLFKMVDKLLQGEKFSTAVGKGVTTGAMAYGASKVGDLFRGSPQGAPTTAGSDATAGAAQDTLSATRQAVEKEAMDAIKSRIANGEIAPGDQGAIRDLAYKMLDGSGMPPQAIETSVEKLITRSMGDVGTSATNTVSGTLSGVTGEQMTSHPAYQAMIQKFGNTPGARQAAMAAAKSAILKGQVNESINLTESQIFLLIGKIVERQRKLDEGIMDTLKGAAGKAADWAQTKGTNLTTKVTADKLLQAWKKAGSPTDSLDVASIIQKSGVPSDSIKQVYTTMQIPFAGEKGAGASTKRNIDVDPSSVAPGAPTSAPTAPASTSSATPASATSPSAQAAPTGSFAQVQELIAKLDPETKTKLISTLKQELSVAESRINELSNEKLGQYKKAASADATTADKAGDYKRGDKRFSGIVRATNKQFANDTKKHSQQGVAEAGNNYHSNTTGFTRPKRDLSGEGEPEGMFMVMIDGRPWKEFTSNTAFQRAKSIATKNPDRKVQVRWPTGQLNTVAEGRYDFSDYHDARLRGDYGMDLPANTSGSTYKELNKGDGTGERGRPQQLKGVSKKLPADPFGRTTGEIPAGKPGRVHSMMNDIDEDWSQKYKSSINCSHPKGFSQKAHCAGKKKHNESIEMEMVCEDCGMCETHVDHKNLDEACWKGYHKEGNKKMFGKTYPNCVKNTNEELDIEEGRENYNGLNILLQKDDEELFVKASAGGRELGHVLFVIDNGYLMPQDLEVEERFRGQGIAQTMYDYVKSKGYKIRRSGQQTDAGAGFWDKHRPEQNVWEEHHSETCPHCGGEMVSEELMNEKKDACYYKVKSRYKVWPSAYASGALVKCRNKGASNWGNGGKKNESSILEGINRADESLHDWFNKEKWVRMDTKGNIKGPCAKEPGEGKPKCLPQAKAHSLGKKGRASAAARKRREDPNPERSGKAINVNTKKKSNENIDEDWKKKLGAAALTGAMALGAAGANARVTPGDDPNINRLTGKPNITQPAQTQTPAKAEAPKGFSKEYLQSVVNGTHPRPMISVEKAQELLKQGQ